MHWDKEVDLLIIGSGNGAMTGAICAHDMDAGDVLVVEKGAHFGGTSALSGGGVWVPCNRYAKAAGAEDSFEDAYAYLDSSIPEDQVPRNILKTYLQNAPKMIDFLHTRTRVRYQSLEKYPDYFSEKPGAKTGHRSMEPEPINITELGDEVESMLNGGPMYIFFKYAITQCEAQILVGKLKGWMSMMGKILLNYYTDLPWLLKGYGFSRRTAGGGAGIIRLRLSMRDRKIPLWLNTTMRELIVEEGRVTGALLSQNGKELRVKARKGVLLAAGGFEKNQAMREKYLPKPTHADWSAGCRTNTGDAINAGLKVGADIGLMDNAWWCTTKCIPGYNYPFLSIITKALPGSIVVNSTGKRFSNESQNYMSFLKETYKKHSDEEPCTPAYMVFDNKFRKDRNVWPLVVPDFMLDKRHYDEGFLAKGDTIQELAENMGANVQNLQDTIERFNQFARQGKDKDFQRGDAAYDRYYGDPEVKPNPCLGPILKPPFHALQIQAGDFGTQGGLVINENAQVLTPQGEVIEGLYACGNCTRATLPCYPGPGSTLGPAMTFAYQAAKHISGWREE